MTAAGFHTVELADAWVEGDGGARWRSGSGLGPSDGTRESGCSLLEVDPGARLPRHTDSAEELVVVIEGEAEVVVAERAERVPAGGVALVPREEPHEVRNAGERVLRFAAVYAGSDVVTRYEAPVQPGGERERRPVE
ncbi:MAG: cupin domain-containing protein [Actinomycetota bacterium]|nr:cupin domain-containing protein [Actinomycetota bacterium]